MKARCECVDDVTGGTMWIDMGRIEYARQLVNASDLINEPAFGSIVEIGFCSGNVVRVNMGSGQKAEHWIESITGKRAK